MPGPPGGCHAVIRPGDGVNVHGSSALIRHSIAWPRRVTSRWRKRSFCPAAMRICSCTMSMPVIISVTGCSTCTRVFISMKKNSSFSYRNSNVPGGPGIRVDSHAYQNYFVPPNYDSMIGKVIAYGDTREQAIARMRVALSEMVVSGIKTNIPLHEELLLDEKFLRGGTSIHYLEERLAKRKQAA